MSDGDEKPVFSFTMKVAHGDISGYYHTRWDRAQPMTVIAMDRYEATDKAKAALGKPMSGWQWEFYFISIDEIQHPTTPEGGRTCRWKIDEYLIKTQCNRTLHWASTVGPGAGGTCKCGGKIVEDE